MYDLIVTIIGKKGNLTAKAAKRRARHLARVIHTTVSPVTAMEMSISGYDEDERELWDIAEVRDYIIVFAETLIRAGVSLDRFIPQTQMVIKACYAKRDGVPVVVTGTQQDTVMEGVEQVLQHQRTSKRFVN